MEGSASFTVSADRHPPAADCPRLLESRRLIVLGPGPRRPRGRKRAASSRPTAWRRLARDVRSRVPDCGFAIDSRQGDRLALEAFHQVALARDLRDAGSTPRPPEDQHDDLASISPRARRLGPPAHRRTTGPGPPSGDRSRPDRGRASRRLPAAQGGSRPWSSPGGVSVEQQPVGPRTRPGFAPIARRSTIRVADLDHWTSTFRRRRLIGSSARRPLRPA